jgi:hypothetical protein
MKVGITGHQNLGASLTVSWLQTRLTELIKQLDIRYGFTSLAVGADQLFAELLYAHSIPYSVIVPCADYLKTFDKPSDADHYKRLLSESAEACYMPYEHFSEDAFFAAGKEVVMRSEFLIAIWNGQPAKGVGGTGDVVNFAICQHKPVLHLNNITKRTIRLSL